MANGYNRQLSYSDSQIADLISAEYGVETDGVSTALKLGRTARAAGISTDNKTQQDLFGDLKARYDSDRQKKNQDNRFEAEKKDPVTVERKGRRDNGDGGGGVAGGKDVDKDAPVPAIAAAKLNQQFFVWRNGEVGRLTVDTPFGFKGL